MLAVGRRRADQDGTISDRRGTVDDEATRASSPLTRPDPRTPARARAPPTHTTKWSTSREQGRVISCERRRDFAHLETGMVKWLHLAGGYGHLRYRPLLWQPVPIDRGVRVDVQKAT